MFAPCQAYVNAATLVSLKEILHCHDAYKTRFVEGLTMKASKASATDLQQVCTSIMTLRTVGRGPRLNYS